MGKVDTFSNYLWYVHGALLQVWGVSTENWLMSSCFGGSTKAIKKLVQRLFFFGGFRCSVSQIFEKKNLSDVSTRTFLSVDKVFAMCFSFNDFCQVCSAPLVKVLSPSPLWDVLMMDFGHLVSLYCSSPNLRNQDVDIFYLPFSPQDSSNK